jgi:hypothetical protein
MHTKSLVTYGSYLSLRLCKTNIYHNFVFNIVTCYLVTRQIICGFWILCSGYWLNRLAEVQLIITLSISVLHCAYNLVITLEIFTG